MNENDKQISGVEATANPAPSQGRRRFTKGALLATPAVMTLMSGRLAAAASTPCEDTTTSCICSIDPTDDDDCDNT